MFLNVLDLPLERLPVRRARPPAGHRRLRQLQVVPLLRARLRRLGWRRLRALQEREETGRLIYNIIIYTTSF